MTTGSLAERMYSTVQSVERRIEITIAITGRSMYIQTILTQC